MELSANRFAANAREALADGELQRALGGATQRLSLARHDAFADFPEGEALRTRAREIKRRTLDRLDGYLEELATSVEARGGTVHWASDAAEAREIVLGLARERGARVAVKSKSMTTEEIALNEALAAAGIEPVETDLGEYILQIAEESPSHIIAPAIHKTKDQISDLFAEKHGTARRERHEEITREARGVLRRRFLEADLGITGVNFAVAETGSIAIVENEGNARLSTSLPRCHIAVMGMEKVIPDLDSLAVFLRILARSATGQKMSSYVSLITGPRREGEEDGPAELHLVILDNGRSAILADPVLRESLYCIRCGACLNVCPVYKHAGGHAYGWVYPGPIGAVVTPSLVGHARAAPLPFASSLCGACREVCPVRIDLPHLLLAQREKVLALTRAKPGERALVSAFALAMRFPALYRMASRLARWLSIPFAREGQLRRAPLLSAWTRTRDLPAPARETFRQRWRRSRG
ncbi:MAG: LutB/LldF family L-lactate oxidation iron-sulfur protein [Myxococcota bacterium]